MSLATKIKIAVLGFALGFGTTAGLATLGYVSARADGSGGFYESAQAIELTAAPPVSVAAEPDVGQLESLWRAGNFVGAGAVLVYVLLAAALKFDRKRAAYYTAGLTALAFVLESLVAGKTPTLGAIMMAVTTLIALVVQARTQPLPPTGPLTGGKSKTAEAP